MNQQPTRATYELASNAISQSIMQLARDASVEINVQDVAHLVASKTLLAPRKKIYVSHLPKQTWDATVAACVAVREAGFDPVPHIPVRLLASSAALNDLLCDFVHSAQVQEVLLIAGDYPESAGPYPAVKEVLQEGLLNKHGIQRVSLAGHPEGHPKVALPEIRRAELEKTMLAAQAGLEVTLLTQFFFEHAPFIQWSSAVRAQGVQARIVGGLSGPASLATLFRFAVRCGVGPSIRALGARPTSLLKLVGEHGPETVLRDLAEARCKPDASFDGIHLFCFGGYLRTCEWLRCVASGQFEWNRSGGFNVLPR